MAAEKEASLIKELNQKDKTKETEKNTPPPFPPAPSRSKKEKEEKEFIDMFRKVAVNIPVLELLAKVPNYTKILKNLCSDKKKLAGLEHDRLTKNVSSVIHSRLLEKCIGQGTFDIPCRIGGKKIERALCDLGAGINVLSWNEFERLNIENLQPTNVVIQLADKSVMHPKGVVEDVLV